jgi:hypothetical protein
MTLAFLIFVQSNGHVPIQPDEGDMFSITNIGIEFYEMIILQLQMH